MNEPEKHIAKIDLIVPFYNPQIGWVDVLCQRIQSLIRQTENYQFYLVLVDDGSQTKYENDVKKIKNVFPNAVIIRNAINSGKGSAIRLGLQHASNDLVMYTDVDIPYTVESMINIANVIVHEKADISICVRSESYYRNIPRSRKVISKIFKSTVKRFFSLPISDTQGGLKAMNKKGVAILSNTKTEGYLFDLEFVRMAGKADLRVVPIVGHTMKDYQNERMQIKTLVKELGDFFRIWWRR